MDLCLALFVDFENLAIEDTDKDPFQISLVLDRLKEKGKILLKRAYADWTRFAKYRRDLQDNGVEMIEMTTRGMTQKNAGDIKIVVDALETAFTRDYVNVFVIVSGDSDFTPLVAKLREYNKSVLGIGRRSSTSRLFIEQCDEFIIYETLVKQRQPAPAQGDLFASLRDALVALDRQGVSEPHFSRVKETLTRKNPAFDEAAAGFRTFGKFLEAAQRRGLVRILRDTATNTSRISLVPDEERVYETAAAKSPEATPSRAVEAPSAPPVEVAATPKPADVTPPRAVEAPSVPSVEREAPVSASETSAPAAAPASHVAETASMPTSEPSSPAAAPPAPPRRTVRRRRSSSQRARSKDGSQRRTSGRSTRTSRSSEAPRPREASSAAKKPEDAPNS